MAKIIQPHTHARISNRTF